MNRKLNTIFSALSYNVKGLRDKLKRNKKFSYTKEKVKNGIIMLQETHSEENDFVKWKKEFDGDIFLNHGTTNSRGTLIALTKGFNYDKISYTSDNEGRIQILALIFDEKRYLIVNIYNENTEQKQVILLKKCISMLETIQNIIDYEIIMGGDFNLITNSYLDAKGGNTNLKLNSLSELAKLQEKFDLCDIYRIRNPTLRRFSFRQNTRNRIKIHRRLDYFFVSSSLQGKILKPDILASIASDHSPIIIHFSESTSFTKGCNYWKMNTSLLQSSEFCNQLIIEIEKVKADFAELNHQLKWEIVKYYIRKFTIDFSKKLAKEKRKEEIDLEYKIRTFETNPLSTEISNEVYTICKDKFENLQNEKIKGQILRSKAKCYEQDEKSSKYFLNLEKKMARKTQ